MEAKPRPTAETPRRTGSLTRIGDQLPPPRGLCSQCQGVVEPVWLPMPQRPRWIVAELCPACAELRFTEHEQERRRKRAEQTLRDRIARAGLASPHRAGRTFATFRSVDGAREATTVAQLFARRMSEAPGQVHRGLLFASANPTEPNGCGKTHLALAILHEVLGSDVARSGLFVEFADYLEALKRSFRRSAGDVSEDPEWVRWSMFQVELLVLDDIGAAASSRGGWDTEEMCRLLNHRIEQGRPIVATADLGPDELADRLGRRVVSRLYEACEMVRIEAGDYRRRAR
mgnify:CR=1 FL=1